ncbi:MAG: prepilin-type N-terminal cleavage/methylation domain-containing protein [Planctomycetota bacterium]
MKLHDANLCRRRAFTLAELLVSMVIVSVLMGGIASAIVVASRSIPDSTSAPAVMLEAAKDLHMISAELQTAASVSERLANAMTFTVPDRNGDGTSEKLRYAWSGTAGDPLTRQYNDGTVVNVLADVREFGLTYNARVTSATTTQTVTSETAESILASFTGWTGVTYTDSATDPSRWASEYFEISIPADAQALHVTRVQLKMKGSATSPGTTVTVALHKSNGAGSPEPQATPLGSPLTVSSPTSTLAQWVSFSFPDLVIPNPAADYCLVVSGSTLGAAYTQYQYSKTGPADVMKFLWTTDSGAIWNPKTTLRDQYEMPFYVYGSFQKTTTQQVSSSRYFLQSVGMKLRTGADATTRVSTAGRLLNEPEVVGP